MKKNVASQSIGAQMITAADGSAFTGSVTCIVTIDGGTQGGGGACTHEGNGYHSYAPSQAETNGNHVAFTFYATGAIPVTIQVYTTFPQSVDNATNISAIKDQTDLLVFDDNDNVSANVEAIGAVADKADILYGALQTVGGIPVIQSDILAINSLTDSAHDGQVKSDLTGINGDSGKVEVLEAALEDGTEAIVANVKQLDGDTINQSGGLINANVKTLDTDSISSDSISADAISKIQVGLATSVQAEKILLGIDAITVQTNAILFDTNGNVKADVEAVLGVPATAEDGLLEVNVKQIDADGTAAETLQLALTGDEYIRAKIVAIEASVTAEIQTGLATQETLESVDGKVDEIKATADKIILSVDGLTTDVIAIKEKTNKMTFDANDNLDSNVKAITGSEVSAALFADTILVSGRLKTQVYGIENNAITNQAIADSVVINANISSIASDAAKATALAAAIDEVNDLVNVQVKGMDFATITSDVLGETAIAEITDAIDVKLSSIHGAGAWDAVSSMVTVGAFTAAAAASILELGVAIATINSEMMRGDDTLAELTADPGATPTRDNAAMLEYMKNRNKLIQEDPADLSGDKYVTYHKNDNTAFLKAKVVDNGTLFTKSKVQAP
jgi:hypothetical protein